MSSVRLTVQAGGIDWDMSYEHPDVIAPERTPTGNRRFAALYDARRLLQEAQRDIEALISAHEPPTTGERTR